MADEDSQSQKGLVAGEADVHSEEAHTHSEEELGAHAHADDEMEEGEGPDEAEILRRFEKAGAIAKRISEDSKKLILPGESLLDIAESVEKMIEDAGAKPGFPTNISINELAAHFTPEWDCETLLGEKDIVKVDLGVQVDGCIGDIAYTIDLSNEQGKLVEASQNALNAAIAAAKPGVKVGEIGGAIEDEIKKLGFKPIENLTGHMLRPYMLHAGVEIPNIRVPGGYELQEGDIFAIEPFATNGEGRVNDTSQVEIFSIEQTRNTRMRQSRQVLAYALENYFTLPFAERWLHKKFQSKLLLGAALKELMGSGILRPYPVLKEAKNGLVSQAELTVVIEKDGARVLTKL